MRSVQAFRKLTLDSGEIIDRALEGNLTIDIPEERTLRKMTFELDLMIQKIQTAEEVFENRKPGYSTRGIDMAAEIIKGRKALNDLSIFSEDLSSAKSALMDLWKEEKIKEEDLSEADDLLYKFWLILQ